MKMARKLPNTHAPAPDQIRHHTAPNTSTSLQYIARIRALYFAQRSTDG